jgi:hypothetical protein
MTKEDIIRMAREAGLIGGPVYTQGIEAKLKEKNGG